VAEVIIIGAGLTGLSAAYHLEKQQFFDYKIFDKQDRPGGLLRSVEQDGFTFDHTGHLLHISDAYFREFLSTITSIDNLDLIARKAGIYSHNVITDYPFQINLHGLPVEVAVECIEGYVTRSKHLKKPHNFHQWVLKHFGKGLGKHFLFPYNTKIYAYDLRKVHPAQGGRFVPSTNLAAIIKGTIEKKPPTVGYNSSFYYPKKGGIEFIIRQIINQLISKIHTNHCVEHIDTINKIVYFSNGHKEHYRRLITTIPLNQLLTSLTPSSRNTLHQQSPKLIHNSVVNINMGFAADTLPSLHWLYFPEKSFPLYRLGFWHNISPSSVPEGKTATYGEFSYRPSTTSKKQLEHKIDDAIKQTLAFLKLGNHHVVTQKILHIDHAYVIYNDWREKNVPKVLAQLQELGIYSTGRYGEWKYSSMQEAVLDGKQAAEKVGTKGSRNLKEIMPAIRDHETETIILKKKQKSSTV